MQNVFLAIGPDAFLLKDFIDQTKKASLAKYGEFAVQTLSAKDTPLSEVITEISTPAFFGGKKIVFIEDFPPPASPKLSEAKKKEYESLTENLKNLPDEVVIFVISTNPDKRTKFFKTIKKEVSKIYEYKPFDPKRDISKFTQWILERVKKYGAFIDLKVAQFLHSFVGNDLEKLDKEIQKLAILTAIKGEQISKENIIALCVPNEESADFAFSNALSTGNAEKIITEISTLSKEFGPAMVWNRDIISSIRTLLKVRFSLESPEEKSGIHPFVASSMSRVVKKFTPEQFQNLHQFLMEVDIKTKNGTLSLSQEGSQFLLHIQKKLYLFFS
ncbi:TPA: DNA polymerase III subunit delta [Candidatus Peregrinibacteria bacterium]|nr:DNA polymerase III subunit delta [Candidatus Peregrinibacteria bacterium]